MNAMRRYLRVVARLGHTVRDEREAAVTIVYAVLILMVTIIFGTAIYLYSESARDQAAADVKDPYAQLELEQAATASVKQATDTRTKDGGNDTEPKTDETSIAEPADSSPASSADSAPKQTTQPVSNVDSQTTRSVKRTAELLISGETTKQLTDAVQDSNGCGGLLGLNTTKTQNCLSGLIVPLGL